MRVEKPGDPSEVSSVPGGEAVESYLREIAPLLRRLVARVCGSSPQIDPGEVEQEVRIRLWRVFSGERTVAPGASYVYRTAVTAAIDAIRRIRARREEPLDSERKYVNPGGSRTGWVRDDVARRTELRQVLQQAIDRVAGERRRAVRLYLQGLTTEEIARALDWTEPKARNNVYRGLADLREALRALGVKSATD